MQIHLNELKIRFIYILISFGCTFIICYSQMDIFIYVLAQPIKKIQVVNNSLLQSDFIYTNIFEGFSSYFYLACLITCYLIMPFFLFTVFNFIKSGLLLSEKKIIVLLIIIFLTFYVSAFFFMYYIFLPLILKFFLSFEQILETSLFTLKLEHKIIDYVYTVGIITFITISLFQIPFVFISLLICNVINFNFLKQNRRNCLIFFFCISLFISPPDICSMFILVLPLIFLFEGVLFSLYIFRNFS